MTNNTMWRLASPLCCAMLLACDLAEPVLAASEADGEQTMAQQDACEAIAGCCGLDPLDLSQACGTALADSVDDLERSVDKAAELGISVARDEACALLPPGVDVVTSCGGETGCAAPCKPYVGTVQAGEVCHVPTSHSASVDDCAQGLLCFRLEDGETTEGVCGDPCDRVGQPCVETLQPAWGPYLDQGSASCGPTAYCNADGLCETTRHAGETCAPDSETCEAEHYCDPQAIPPVCVPQLADGQPCNAADACYDGSCSPDGASMVCVSEELEDVGIAQGSPLGCNVVRDLVARL